MDKEFNEYIPNIKLVRALNRQFDSDFNTRTFSEYDFETYLCALTYACAGKELFYGAKISYKLSNEQKNNEQFMQGMLTFSLIEKINKAEKILNSEEFKKSLKVDLSKLDAENDYASIAFILYYLTTKGFKVEWDKMCHAYSPINLSNGPISFVKSQAVDPNILIERVQNKLQQGATI